MYHCMENGQLIKWTQTGKFKHLADAVNYMDDYLELIPHHSFIEERNRKQTIEGVTFEIVYVADVTDYSARKTDAIDYLARQSRRPS